MFLESLCKRYIQYYSAVKRQLSGLLWYYAYERRLVNVCVYEVFCRVNLITVILNDDIWFCLREAMD